MVAQQTLTLFVKVRVLTPQLFLLNLMDSKALALAAAISRHGNICAAFLVQKTGLCVAKVVKIFGCIAETTETLDEFRCKILLSPQNASRRCQNGVSGSQLAASLTIL